MAVCSGKVFFMIRLKTSWCTAKQSSRNLNSHVQPIPRFAFLLSLCLCSIFTLDVLFSDMVSNWADSLSSQEMTDLLSDGQLSEDNNTELLSRIFTRNRAITSIKYRRQSVITDLPTGRSSGLRLASQIAHMNLSRLVNFYPKFPNTFRVLPLLL